jgi:hypothetical protein
MSSRHLKGGPDDVIAATFGLDCLTGPCKTSSLRSRMQHKLTSILSRLYAWAARTSGVWQEVSMSGDLQCQQRQLLRYGTSRGPRSSALIANLPLGAAETTQGYVTTPASVFPLTKAPSLTTCRHGASLPSCASHVHTRCRSAPLHMTAQLV